MTDRRLYSRETRDLEKRHHARDTGAGERKHGGEPKHTGYLDDATQICRERRHVRWPSSNPLTEREGPDAESRPKCRCQPVPTKDSIWRCRVELPDESREQDFKQFRQAHAVERDRITT